MKKPLILMIVVILFAVIIAAFFYNLPQISNPSVFFTPDEESFSLFSNILTNSSLPIIQSPLNSIYNTTAFSPSFTVSFNGNSILPDHMGFVYLYL